MVAHAAAAVGVQRAIVGLPTVPVAFNWSREEVIVNVMCECERGYRKEALGIAARRGRKVDCLLGALRRSISFQSTGLPRAPLQKRLLRHKRGNRDGGRKNSWLIGPPSGFASISVLVARGKQTLVA
jgi:hypothetical protein